MAASAADDVPIPQIADNDLKPFFVLHKASPRQRDRRSFGKTRRKIDLSSSLAKTKGTEHQEADATEAWDDQRHESFRMKAFHHVWCKIESSIKDVLWNINVDVFNEIDCWVHKSFGVVCSRGMSDNKANCTYPTVTDVTAKQLFTGLVVTKNMEFVDDLQTFADLSLHLQSRGCHVANLSSLDFSAKNGIGGCLRSLLRQVLMASIDSADITILASWYIKQGNDKNPVVVIIDDMDRCCGSVLSDFILMLSEWVVKIPIVLIMGVATTLDAPRNILSSNALQYLCPFTFSLRSPADRLDAIIEGVLVKQCSGFTVGHNVAAFLRKCFLRQDGTLTFLIRALKMSVVQHFLMEPLSFMVKGLLDEEGSESWEPALLPEALSKHAFDLPSCRSEDGVLSLCCKSVARIKLSEPNDEIWSHGLSEMKRLQNLWSSVVLCLYEGGKNHKITLLDLYYEALDPELYDSRGSDYFGLEPDPQRPLRNQCMHGQSFGLHKSGFIGQTVLQVRDLPTAALCQLLEGWEKLTGGVNEIHEKVKELRSLVKFDDDKCLKGELASTSKRHTTRSNIMEKNSKSLHERVATVVSCMVRDYMRPIECIPLHELVCFKNVDKLQSSLIGDPRRRIQVDLLECHKFLKCSCCSKSCNTPLPSMHDTTIMYTLAQEHGDLINLHDWYQSFKATIIHPKNKERQRLKQSPSPKKRKCISEPQNITEASVQARFCRAVTELQITGLLRMPSKRRPDYVQRVAFGL